MRRRLVSVLLVLAGMSLGLSAVLMILHAWLPALALAVGGGLAIGVAERSL